MTRILLAVDQSDPAGTDAYLNDNLGQLRALEFGVDVFRPNEGTHEVTDAMKAAVLQEIPSKYVG